MNLTTKWSLRMIDLAGGAVVAACLGAFVWFALLRTDRTSDVVGQLRGQLQAARHQARVLRAECDRQRLSLNAHQTELGETGELPVHARVEEYFRNLASLAAQHRVRVMRHNPLASRTYSGLLERRFSYQVTGATVDLARFLRAIELTEFWADVAYLKIEGGPNSAGVLPERVATLTISVFSALAPEEEGRG